MRKLDVEKSEDYTEAEKTIQFLKLVRYYYETDLSFDELETGDIQIREIFRFMSENGFPKRGFVTNERKAELIENIKEEISNIENDLKKARLDEIEGRKLKSLIIIPSWSKVIGHETKGFYLNKPVTELKRDTIIMLSHDIMSVTDKLGTELALLTGPGLFFTEFSLDGKSHIVNSRDINMIMLPMDKLATLLDAPPIFTSDIDATLNELISIIPFSLIEEAYATQAILRGVISRNIFHPNKAALDTFMDICSSPESYNPNNGFKIMSAHEEYFNRLLLTEAPTDTRGDASFNISSAGIASILLNGKVILDELVDQKEQSEVLLHFKDIKQEFDKLGKDLLSNWLP
ncbi:MAG: hypothetical protein ACXAE3_01415 [Candidatus Kariarchaeaceae archaeon]|jgi:hypothetical protein